MAIQRVQAFTIIWLSVALTATGILFVLLASFAFGPGIGILSALLYALFSLFIYISALVYSSGEPASRTTVPPSPKSRIKRLLLSQKGHPFRIQNGRTSDLQLSWTLPKPSKTSYSMRIWLDEKTRTCAFTEEVTDGTTTRRLGPTTSPRTPLSETRDIHTPSLWPALSGRKKFDAHEARQVVWDVCENNGWTTMRR